MLVQLVVDRPLTEEVEPSFLILDQTISALVQAIEAFSQISDNKAKITEATPRKQNAPPGEDNSWYYSPMRQLENIQKLLDAAHILMKAEPDLDRDAIEHVRRARVKTRFAISAKGAVGTESTAEFSVPQTAPEYYKDRADKKENPIEFIKRVYADWLGKGLSRADIATLDRRLYDSMNVYVSSHGGDFPDIGLPSRAELIERRLQDNAGQKVKLPSRTKRVHELSSAERQQVQLYYNVRRRKDRAP